MASQEVVKLTAPIVFKIDKASLTKAKKAIKGIAEELDEVVTKIDQVVSRVVVALDKIGIANQKVGKGTAKQALEWDKYRKKANRALKTANKKVKEQSRLLKRLKKDIQESTKEVKKQGSQAKRTAKAWGKLPDIMAQIRTNLGLVEFAAAKVFQALAIPAGTVVGSLFFLDRINATTTEMSKLAEASGVSLNFIKAMSAQAKLLGFNFNNVLDLAEELNNKVGGQASGFEEINLLEGIKTLGVEFENLKDLDPEEQFTKIAVASQKMLKSGKLTFQEIVSANDKIFGGEGNRLLGMIAKMNVGLDEYLERQKKITGLSSEIEQGAIRFTVAFNDVQSLLGRVFNTLAASIGGKLAPSIELIVNRFLEMEDVVDSLIDEFGELFTDLLVQGMLVMGDIFKAFNDNKAEIIEFLKNLTIILVKIFKLGISLAITAIKIFNAAAPIIKGIFNTLRLLFFTLSSFPQGVFKVLVPLGLASLIIFKVLAAIVKIKGVSTLLSEVGLSKALKFKNIWKGVLSISKSIWGWVSRIISTISSGSWMTRVMTFVKAIGRLLGPIALVISTALAGFGIGTGIAKVTGLADEDSGAVDFFSKAFEGAEFNFRQARFQADQDMKRFAKNRAADRAFGGNTTTTTNSGGNTIMNTFNLEGQEAVEAVNELQTGPMLLN